MKFIFTVTPVLADPSPALTQSENSENNSMLANKGDVSNNNVLLVLHKMTPDEFSQNVVSNNDGPSTGNKGICLVHFSVENIEKSLIEILSQLVMIAMFASI